MARKRIEKLANGQKVDWSNPQLMPRPNGRQNDVRYPVTCKCGNVRWLNTSQIRRIQQCQHCRNVKAGKAGYRATRRRYGKKIAQSVLQRVQNERRSWAELLVEQWLCEAGYVFETNVIFDTNRADKKARWFALDFVIDGTIAIEVNGWGHKTLKRKRRDEALGATWPGLLLTISTDDLRANASLQREKLLNELTLHAAPPRPATSLLEASIAILVYPTGVEEW